ncbi:MAG TPA: hypothetical protein VGL70_24620 [Candidatus Binatia bacterium]|jgi:hypothetical protein
MVREERVAFQNARKQKLVGVLHRPAMPPDAAAILCHGMESSKEMKK